MKITINLISYNCWITCIAPGAKPSWQAHSNPPSTLEQVPLPQIPEVLHSLSSETLRGRYQVLCYKPKLSS